jgi:Phospholipase_D-nuclease N-terminal
MVVGAYTFWDAMWTMIVFFAWLMFFWWVVLLLVDNFRRTDHSGWAKAGWALFIIFLPVIGALAYTIARPEGAIAGDYGYGYDTPTYAAAAPRSTADELARLNELRTEGAISDAEFETLKGKTIATA